MTGADPTQEATTVSVTIHRPPADVYAFVADLGNLPLWSFFSTATEVDGTWRLGTSRGEVILRLAAANDLGVLDHDVETPDGRRIYIPMRVVPNGDGSEVLFTAFRQPGMSDEEYAADIAQVETDLANLKSLLEDDPAGS